MERHCKDLYQYLMQSTCSYENTINISVDIDNYANDEEDEEVESE
jgi:hypothetical protein